MDIKPKNKLFVKFISDTTYQNNNINENEINSIISFIKDKEINKSFIIGSGKKEIKAYCKQISSHLEDPSILQQYHIKKIKKKNVSYIKDIIDDIYNSVKSTNCEIVFINNSMAGIILASLDIKSGKTIEEAIKRIKLYKHNLEVSDEAVSFINEFNNYIKQEKGDFEDFLGEVSLPESKTLTFDHLNAQQNDEEKSLKISFLERFSIRTKMIVVIIIIITISLSFMIYFANYFFKSDSEKRVKENNHNFANMIAGKVEKDIESYIEKARIISSLINEKKSENTKNFVNNLLKESALVYFVIVDKKNKIKKSIYNEKFHKDTNLKKEKLKEIFFASKSFYNKSFNHLNNFRNISPEAGFPLLEISIPYSVYNNKVESVLVFYIALDDLLKSFKTEGIVTAFMVNDVGDLIAHADRKKILSRINLTKNIIVQMMLSSKLNNGQARYESSTGKYFLGSFKKIDLFGLGVVVTAEESIIFEEVYRLRTRNIIILLIILNFSILVVFFFSKTLTIPIVKLVKATQEFQSKALTVQDTGKIDEISFLTRSFKAMVNSIINSQKALNMYAENLETMVEERTDELKKARDALWGEMELAAKIQTVLIPGDPLLEGYEIAGYMKPADEVGGDYYDIINIAGKDWVVIGDVSGHGVTSGLIMMMVQTAVHIVLEQNPNVSPSDLLTIVNRVIAQNIKSLGEKKYMTITVCALGENGIFYHSGLHIDLLIYRHSIGDVERIKTKGIWIGLLDDIGDHLHDNSFVLNNNDVLLLYTDGVVEPTNENDEYYSTERLIDYLKKHGSDSVDIIKDKILESLHSFNTDDDVTFVVLKRI